MSGIVFSKRLVILGLCTGLLASQTACSQPSGKSNLVAQAYDSSGVLNGVPYKRTIFSSTDF